MPEIAPDRLEEIRARYKGYIESGTWPGLDIADLLAEINHRATRWSYEQVCAANNKRHDQIDAVLAIHKPVSESVPQCSACLFSWPCPTARALGITEEQR